jgi:hypothetical protein
MLLHGRQQLLSGSRRCELGQDPHNAQSTTRRLSEGQRAVGEEWEDGRGPCQQTPGVGQRISHRKLQDAQVRMHVLSPGHLQAEFQGGGRRELG